MFAATTAPRELWVVPEASEGWHGLVALGALAGLVRRRRSTGETRAGSR